MLIGCTVEKWMTMADTNPNAFSVQLGFSHQRVRGWLKNKTPVFVDGNYHTGKVRRVYLKRDVLLWERT